MVDRATMPIDRVMHRRLSWAALWLLGCACLLAVLPGHAQDDGKPFAEAHVLLQVSDADPVKQAAAIDIANNLMKHYGGPDTVDIEILAFGPGIDLYRADNPLRPRLESLLPSGVRLVVCKNTLDTLERTTGAAPQLIDGLIYVQTGVARIVERVGQGFVLVKP